MQLTESQRHKLLYPDFRNGFFAADAKHKPVGVRKIPAWCYATLANTSCDMRLRLEDPFEQTTEIMLNLAEWNALIQKLMELRGITPVIAGR